MKPIHTVFYSWQSDLQKDSNLNAIRQSLRNAANEIEIAVDETRLEIDEATRNTSGSPNIPITIFNKIAVADIFVCDLTTINSNTNDIRKMPNPNVLIELGYAIASLGWERIIMVFNTNFGNFPQDLPFDVDRHRATPFSIVDKNDKVGRQQLSSTLKTAILAIIKIAPLKPSELTSQSPFDVKRRKDVENLRLLLNYIHIPTVDLFIEEIPSILINDIFYYKDKFGEISESNSFHIYDKKLTLILDKLKNNWNILMSYPKHYDREHNGKNFKFFMPFDTPASAESQTDYKYLLTVRLELEKNFKSLFKLIRLEYLEIDLDETSKNALEIYEQSKN